MLLICCRIGKTKIYYDLHQYVHSGSLVVQTIYHRMCTLHFQINNLIITIMFNSPRVSYTLATDHFSKILHGIVFCPCTNQNKWKFSVKTAWIELIFWTGYHLKAFASNNTQSIGFLLIFVAILPSLTPWNLTLCKEWSLLQKRQQIIFPRLCQRIPD